MKVSDLIGQKEPSFAFIAVGVCEVMKVLRRRPILYTDF